MTDIFRPHISERVSSLAPSGIRKFFDLLLGMDDVISLGVGEPDFSTPWRIREAAIHSLEKGHTHYSSNYGLIELREKISDDLEGRYGVAYEAADQVLVTVGVSEALDLAMRALLEPGDEVIVPEPTYVSYVPCILLAGGVPVPVPTTEEEDFKVRASDIEARLTPRTKGIMLGYPSNPTGAVLDRRDLEAVAAVARRNSLWVVSDEVYDRLVYEQEHVCVASLDGMQDRTVLLGGFSKGFAMTGWRVGYAAAQPHVIEAMMKIHQYTMLCAPTMSQIAALEALTTGQGEVEEMVAQYDQRRRLMIRGLNQIGMPCLMPKGAFYAFPSIKATGLTSEEFAELLLREERVAVVPGSAFGLSGEGHVRCCYAVSVGEIEEALQRISRFVKRRLNQKAPPL